MEQVAAEEEQLTAKLSWLKQTKPGSLQLRKVSFYL